MAKQFYLTKRVVGYSTKPDKTNISPEFLVEDSQNVLINDREMVEIREGYTLFGSANSNTNPIESAYDWETSSGDIIHLRSYDEYLQFYVGTVDGIEFNDWVTLADGFSAVDFCFTTWWDTNEDIDLLVFVNGSDKFWDWSGAMTTLKSATSNTITKNGSTTWAQERFKTSGTRKVVINGTEYTYTGGENTTTLTGVTPDPSGEAANSLVFQAITLHDDEPADGATNDICSVLNNQLYLGGGKSREVSVSKDDDFTDFSFSSPRVPGEGALLVLDSIPKAFVPLNEVMWISAGRNDWYKTELNELEVSGTLTETLKIKKLKTGSDQGAQSQDLVCTIGDYIAYISYEPALRLLGTMEELELPHMPIISDPIKPDFDAETFTNGHIKFHRNRIYISAPASGKVYINELKQTADGSFVRFWQPPQILPIRKFAIIDGEIYGHSDDVPETYKLFDGINDNGNSIEAKAAFAYRSYGLKANLKTVSEWLTEGYISSNTKLTLTLNYDYEGYTQQLEYEIDGSDDSILYQPSETGVLGDEVLGDRPLGDLLEEAAELAKFRVIHGIVPRDFFEIQAIYSTNDVDQQWKILAHGGNVSRSKNEPIKIKK